VAIKVVIVDHLAAFRHDLTRFLQLLDPGYDVVADVGTADEALACVAALGPDLVLTAVELPDRTGLAVAREALRIRPMTVVIVMGDGIAAEYAEAALAAGADSYVDQVDLVRALPLALRAAAQRINERAHVRQSGEDARDAAAW